MTKDEMVGWHHQLNGHEFEQTQRDNEGQGSLACCTPWGRKESDTTKLVNNTTTWVLSLKTMLTLIFKCISFITVKQN